MQTKPGLHWLLLRGLARESAHWGEFVPLLQAVFPDARVTTLDLPGTGRFFQEASPGTIAGITESVRAQALEQGLLQQPVTILGVSLGAMVAWDWLLRYPDDSCGAVLMNTSFAGLSPFYRRLRWQSYGRFFALAMQRDIRRRELAIVALVSNRKEQYRHVADAWAKIQSACPIGFKNCAAQIIAAATFRPGDLKPRQPVLLLNGQGDRLVSPLCSQAISRKWALECRSHPWAGHDLTLDDGTWVVLQLQDWLATESV